MAEKMNVDIVNVINLIKEKTYYGMSHPKL